MQLHDRWRSAGTEPVLCPAETVLQTGSSVPCVATVKVGSIFLIPLATGQAMCGQVLRVGKVLTVVVFAEATSPDHALAHAESAQPALLCQTFDALLHHKRWPVVGHLPARTDFPMPTFKVSVGTPDNVIEEDIDGTRLRSLSPAEAEALPFRKVVAPIRLDKAAKAMNGEGTWEPEYDSLLLPGR
jgi:hypothetical protein